MSTIVHAALAKRFPSPEWATFFEVRDDAGFKARRSADVVAMNTWPSRGLSVHGVEVKISRSDWLRELKDPAKSASIQRYCDRWWLAVSDDSVAKLEEIPETWGFLVLRGKVLVQAKDAPTLTSAPLDRGFVAMLLRNATSGMVPNATVQELVEERTEARLRQNRGQVDLNLERMTRSFNELRDRVAKFKEASGIDINDRWAYRMEPAALGAAIKAILSGAHERIPGELDRALNLIDRLSKECRDTRDALAALHLQKDNQL